MFVHLDPYKLILFNLINLPSSYSGLLFKSRLNTNNHNTDNGIIRKTSDIMTQENQ